MPDLALFHVPHTLSHACIPRLLIWAFGAMYLTKKKASSLVGGFLGAHESASGTLQRPLSCLVHLSPPAHEQTHFLIMSPTICMRIPVIRRGASSYGVSSIHSYLHIDNPIFNGIVFPSLYINMYLSCGNASWYFSAS